MSYLNNAVYLCFAVAIIALPFVVFGVLRAVNRAPPISNPATRLVSMPQKSILLFAGAIAICMSLSQVICFTARNEAFQFLTSLPNSHSTAVNGNIVSDDSSLIAALKSTHWVMGHHSHPTTTIHIAVENNGHTMKFNLGRDSSDPHEYWVFLPEYRVSSMNDIGRITTNLLDGY
jgi:hypothetical protein